VGLIDIPSRYLHTPTELFDLHDVEAAIDLICGWIRHDGASW
jgi:putative aminopeptidase FrvX